jgi:hypothetical protein
MNGYVRAAAGEMRNGVQLEETLRTLAPDHDGLLSFLRILQQPLIPG